MRHVSTVRKRRTGKPLPTAITTSGANAVINADVARRIAFIPLAAVPFSNSWLRRWQCANLGRPRVAASDDRNVRCCLHCTQHIYWWRNICGSNPASGVGSHLFVRSGISRLGAGPGIRGLVAFHPAQLHFLVMGGRDSDPGEPRAPVILIIGLALYSADLVVRGMTACGTNRRLKVGPFRGL